MSCEICASDGDTVKLACTIDGELKTVDACEVCFNSEMVMRTLQNKTEGSNSFPIYSWKECKSKRGEPTQEELQAVISIVRESLAQPSIVSDDNDALKEMCKNLPISMYRHIAQKDLQADMFFALVGNLVTRMGGHINHRMLISELDAAVSDWEIMVNLHYKPKAIRSGAHEDMLDVVKEVRNMGVRALKEAMQSIGHAGFRPSDLEEYLNEKF